jgi:hypothetical protein
MSAPRTAGSMAAVKVAPKARVGRVSSRVKDSLLVASLILGVTAGGMALGAYGVSPLIGDGVGAAAKRVVSAMVGVGLEVAIAVVEQPKVSLTLAITVVVAIGVYVGTGVARRRSRRRVGVASSSTLTFTGRTPRDVQVLAAAGTAPADIAARTRMPVDAVSMLLSLGQSRQVPTA